MLAIPISPWFSSRAIRVLASAVLGGASAPNALAHIALTHHEISTSLGPGAAIAAGEINVDGAVDIVSRVPSGIGWFAGTTGPVPTFQERTVPNDFDPRSFVQVADLDGDVDLDVIAGALTGLAWFENLGGANPTFTRRNIDTASVTAVPVDVDLDGDVDVLSVSGGNVDLLRSNGASPPSFTVSTVASGTEPLVAEDMNSDGYPDACQPFCPGDVTGNLLTIIGDFNVLASNFGGVYPLRRIEGDLTGDGRVNIADFNVLAGDFGCDG